MNSKRALHPILIWLISIAVGLLLCEFVMENRWYHMNLVYKYIVHFGTMLGFSISGLLLVQTFELKLLHFKIHPLIFSGFTVLFSVGLTLFRMYCFIGDTIINGCIMLMIYPLVYLSLSDCYKKKLGYLWSVFIFLVMFSAIYFLTGPKMVFISVVIYSLALVYGINIYKPEKKIFWVITSVIMFVAAYMFLLYVAFSREHVMNNLLGFINPKEMLEYNELYKWISDFKWFDFSLKNSFTEDINSVYAAPYAHFYACFGLIPTLILIFSQLAALIMMYIEALHFKEERRKFLGMISVTVPALHFLITTSISFLRLPLAEFGSTFITIMGLEYCVVPIFFYYVLWFGEKKVSFLGVIKHYFSSKREDNDNIFLEDFDVDEDEINITKTT